MTHLNKIFQTALRSFFLTSLQTLSLLFLPRYSHRPLKNFPRSDPTHSERHHSLVSQYLSVLFSLFQTKGDEANAPECLMVSPAVDALIAEASERCVSVFWWISEHICLPVFWWIVSFPKHSCLVKCWSPFFPFIFKKNVDKCYLMCPAPPEITQWCMEKCSTGHGVGCVIHVRLWNTVCLFSTVNHQAAVESVDMQ